MMKKTMSAMLRRASTEADQVPTTLLPGRVAKHAACNWISAALKENAEPAHVSFSSLIAICS